MSLLRVWLAVSAIGLAGLMVWAFAPVLLMMLLVTIGLGVLAALMIHLARRLEAWRDRHRL